MWRSDVKVHPIPNFDQIMLKFNNIRLEHPRPMLDTLPMLVIYLFNAHGNINHIPSNLSPGN